MKSLRKHKMLAGAICAAILVLIIAVVINKPRSTSNDNDKGEPSAGAVEKEGDVSLIPEGLLSQEQITIGVSGIGGTPYLPTSDGDEAACSMVYQPLLTYDTDGSLLPVIADKIEVNATGDEFKIYLNENSKFSNGSRVTPEDIKGSYQLVSDPSIESQYNAALSYIKGYSEFRDGLAMDIEGIITGTDYVIFRFIRPSWRNIYALNLPITNSSEFEYEKGTAKSFIPENTLGLLGTGAYMLSAVSPEGIEMHRNGAAQDEFSQVLIAPADASSAASLFQAGKLDIYVFENDERLLSEIMEMPEASLYAYPAFTAPYVGINCRNDGLNDIKVRDSIALAVKGQTDKARKQLMSAGYELYSPESSAKSGKALDISIITFDNPSFTKECSNIAELLEAAGIRCQMTSLGLNEFRGRVEDRSFDLYYSKSEVGKHGSVYFLNNDIEGLEDETIERLKRELEDAPSYESYRKIYAELVNAYEAQSPRVALEGSKRYILYSPRLKGITPNPYTNAFWQLERYKKNTYP